jgi:LAGLIDADG endonuclease
MTRRDALIFQLAKVKKKSKLGWVVQARLIVELHLKDIALLRNLQSFFGGIGNITTTATVARFSIVGLNDIINFVLPHFDNFPLQSVKLIEFGLWRAGVIIMTNKGKFTLEGLK